jgi:hypothetical protein
LDSSSHWRRRPGIDFTKLHFGRKVFGQFFITQVLDKFLHKKQKI